MGICFSSSSDENHHPPPRAIAKVISIEGQLREYLLPVLASQVLVQEGGGGQQQEEAATVPFSSPSGSTTSTSCFLCDADQLSYDDYIPVLDSDAPLSPDHMYYVLPISRLQRRLRSSDMAALAVKASLALQNPSKSSNNNNNKDSESSGRRRRRGGARVSPAVVVPLNHHSSNTKPPPAPREYSSSSSTTSNYYAILNNESIKNFGTRHHQPKRRPPHPQPVSRFSSVRRRRVRKYAFGSTKPKFTVIRSFRLRLSTIYEGEFCYTSVQFQHFPLQIGVLIFLLFESFNFPDKSKQTKIYISCVVNLV